MKQSDINRLVARATGESVSTIKSFGFHLNEPFDETTQESDDLGPHVIDWDELESEHYRDPIGRPQYDLAAA